MRLFIYLLLCALAFPSRATEQSPDKILVDGEEYVLLSQSPFGSLLSRPDMDSALKDAVNHAGPKSTGNWRGYIAAWEIRGKRLLLRSMDLSGGGRNPHLLPLSTFFPGQDSPVDAIWYSGTLLVGKGTGKRSTERPQFKPDIDRHYEYGRTVRYEGYLKLEISNGYVSSREDYEPNGGEVAAPMASPKFSFTPEIELAFARREVDELKSKLKLVADEKAALSTQLDEQVNVRKTLDARFSALEANCRVPAR